jgi:hypothetical protein
MMLIPVHNDVNTSFNTLRAFNHIQACLIGFYNIITKTSLQTKQSYRTRSSFDQTFNMDPHHQTGTGTGKPIGERIMESIPGTEQHRATHGVTRKNSAPRLVSCCWKSSQLGVHGVKKTQAGA